MVPPSEMIVTTGGWLIDRVGQLDRRGGPEPPALDALEHAAGVLERVLQRHVGVQGPVNRDEMAGSDELVELEQVHVTGRSQLGCVQDREDGVGVGVRRRQMVAFVAHRQSPLVEPEEAREQPLGVVVVTRDVHPHEAVVTVEQRGKLVDSVVLDRAGGQEMNIHEISSLLIARADQRAVHPKCLARH